MKKKVVSPPEYEKGRRQEEQLCLKKLTNPVGKFLEGFHSDRETA